MNLRRITSLSSLLSFIAISITGVALYIVPHGRVAYWSDWHFLGLTKTQWEEIHTNISVMFLLAIFLHIYLNRKPIVNYLKNKADATVIFTKEFNVALVLLLVFCAGTYFQVPPFKWINDVGGMFEDHAVSKYGEPPYEKAERSALTELTQQTGMSLALGLERLEKAGIKFENASQSLEDIAKNNDTTPNNLYLIMKPPDLDSGLKNLEN